MTGGTAAPEAAAAPADGADVRERVVLEFTGLDGGGAELTWGQRFVWDILAALAPHNHFISLRLRVHLPPDATRERVLGALHALVRRHEVLRTRFPAGPDGEPRQECDGQGALAVEIAGTTPGRVRRTAERDEDRLWHEPFRHAQEWPLRASVVTSGGRPRQVVLVLSHLAADAWGLTALRAEFLALLRGGDAAQVPPAGVQSRDRAAYEASEPGRRAGDASLAYWRQTLRTAPQTVFPNLSQPGERPLFPGTGLQSVALAAAAQAVAGRLRVSPSAALLGALAAILGVRTGTGAVPLALATGNRFTPADAASVGTYYQVAPVLLPVDAGSLAATVRAAHRASSLAYLRGNSDPREVARLTAAERVRRGAALGTLSTVNIAPEAGPALPPAPRTAAELRALTADTVLADLEGRDEEQLKIYFHVKALRSRAVVELFTDSRYLDAASARALLAGLETVLIELCEAGDLDLDRVAELTGVTPLGQPADAVVADHCRVSPEAVGALLAALPGATAARVFTEPTGEEGSGVRLVGYLVTGRPTTPEQVHAAVLDRLDGALTMAPHHYVLCRHAPARPESRAAWERVPVVLQGSGRPGDPPAAAGPTPTTDASPGA
ncbi:condensation domain-containing protein [Streptomyces sp. NRRL F-5123]|uniref:condensation domain-containing protein n=1 Tax=Streptomyces sp. NRRL F-5123 TaxID=1463856 RepID=UPI0004E14E99|nr:condensation domain-containing protein [Streptomyces sp. NRRL F-5123]